MSDLWIYAIWMAFAGLIYLWERSYHKGLAFKLEADKLRESNRLMRLELDGLKWAHEIDNLDAAEEEVRDALGDEPSREMQAWDKHKEMWGRIFEEHPKAKGPKTRDAMWEDFQNGYRSRVDLLVSRLHGIDMARKMRG